MKNYIKKIMVGFLGFVMLISSQSAFAGSVTWNQASNDCKGLSIINATTLEGYENPCWPSSSVSADKGETINVRIYYHNTGTVTATNTRVMLIPTTSLDTSSKTKTFTGRIVSDQGSISFSSSVRANISSSQSLTLSSVKWYTNNKSETLTPLLNGQTGSEVLTDRGLSIGSITAGWPSQGSVVVAFKISSNTTPEVCQDTSATNYGGPLPCTYPPQVCKDPNATNYGGALPCVYPHPVSCTISNFEANPNSITTGNSSVLTWNTNNCNQVVITPNVGTYGPSGSKTVYPAVTTTYTLKAYAPNGTLGDTDNVTVTVNSIPVNMTGNLSASSSSCTIAEGNSTCGIPFSWTTQNPEATSSITHDGMTVANGNNGSKTFAISKGTQTYYLYNNSKLLDTETVSASCASGTSWNGSVCERVVVNNCTINNFNANPTSITSGESSVLSWNTSNCVNVVISNLNYNVPNSGSQAVYPTVTKTYTLTAYGQNGASDTRSVTVYVNQPSVCQINHFTASPSSITKGESSTLSWDTTDCNSVSISSIGTVSTSGSRSVSPTSTKTYTLTAYGANNVTQTKSVTVYVDDSSMCVINDFMASRSHITQGQSSILNWSTENCVNVVISNLNYNVPNSGSQAVYPTVTKTYTLTAYGQNGASDTRSVTV
ncbi:MAG TPA: hypothetical protein VK153_03370, partial [Candidatus Paceibacterota bacterium]|nr:hypothetical protein [Candidatus Paceibacterota bacterium]